MKRTIAIVVVLSFLLAGCGKPQYLGQGQEQKYYPTYGLFNDGSSKSKNVCYEISVGNVIFTSGQNQVIQYPETEEQRVAREAEAVAWQAKQDAVAKRAEELLLMHLSDEQCRQYQEHGYFEAPPEAKKVPTVNFDKK